MDRKTPDWDKRPNETQQVWSLSITWGGTATRFYLGIAPEAGLTLRQLHALAPTALAKDGTNFLTFKPFVMTHKDSVASVRYLDTSRTTSAVGVVADIPFRLHDKELLNERLPKGAVVGVDITEGGAVADQTVTLQASLIRTSG